MPLLLAGVLGLALAAAPASAGITITSPGEGAVVGGDVDVYASGTGLIPNSYYGVNTFWFQGVMVTNYTGYGADTDASGAFTNVKVLTWHSLHSPSPNQTGYIQLSMLGPRGMAVYSNQVTVTNNSDFTISDCDSTFLPKGGAEDNTTPFTASVTGGSANGRIRFNLLGTSSEPGYCLNAGTEATTDYDLKFDNGAQQRDYTNVNSAATTVYCYDYGAYGRIKAEFGQPAASPSWWRTAKVEGGTATEIRIPRDSNDNHIADSWAGNNGAATDDDESSPAGNGTNGDGLSRYEEYRGFMSQGAHVRTDAAKKTVHVWDEAGYGLAHFEDLGLEICQVNSSERNASNQINHKYESHHVMDQLCIHLVDDGWHDAKFWHCSDTDGHDIPFYAIVASIYTQTIRLYGPPTHNTSTWDAKDIEARGWSISAVLANDVDIPNHSTGDTDCYLYWPGLGSVDWDNLPNQYTSGTPNCPSYLRLR